MIKHVLLNKKPYPNLTRSHTTQHLPTNRVYYILMIICFLFTNTINAAECSATYADAAGTSSSLGSITFVKHAQITNSPDNILDIPVITGDAGTYSCGTANCTSSNATVEPLDPGPFLISSGTIDSVVPQNGSNGIGFGSTSQYDAVLVDQGGTLTISDTHPEYRINTLVAVKHSNIDIPAGDYWIADLIIDQGVSLRVTGSGTVRIYTNSATIIKNSNLNALGDPSQLFIYSYGNIFVDQGVTTRAYLYAANDIFLGKNSLTEGAVSATNIVLDQGAQLDFNGESILTTDFGTACENTPPINSPDHYRIEFDGSAVTCAAETITIKACANADCSTLFDQEQSLFFHSINLSRNFTLIDLTFTGSTTVQLAETSETFIFMTLLSRVPLFPDLPLYPYVPLFDVDCYSSGFYNFLCGYGTSDTGFIFRNESTNTVNNFVTQLSNKPSNSEWNAQNYSIQAIQTDTNTGACTGLFADNSDVDIDLAYQCDDPSNCVGDPVTLSNNNNDYSLAKYPNYQSVPLHFTSDSKAFFSFNYPEAGDIKFQAKKAIELIPGTTKILTGNSNSFLVKPFGLKLDLNGDPTAFVSALDNSAFVRAGQNFIVNATAVRWVSGEEGTIIDGKPDDLSLLNDNPTAANFYNKTLALNHQLVQPATGVAGTLGGQTNSATFTNSVASAGINWSEVGVINLSAQLTSNLSDGTNLYGAINNIGRFVPDHFTFLNGSIANSCNTFTYMGQDFSTNINIQAQNSSNQITQNYFADHAPATLVFVAENDIANNEADDTDESLRLSVAPLTWNAGQFDDSLTSTFSRIKQAPLNNIRIGFQIDDGEPTLVINLSNTLNMNAAQPATCLANPAGAEPQCDALQVGLTQSAFLYGRMNGKNIYSPADQAIDLPLFTEFFVGTNNNIDVFGVNVADTCTVFNAADFTISNQSLVNFASYNVFDIDTTTDIGNVTVSSTNSAIAQIINGNVPLQFAVPSLVDGKISGEIPVNINLINHSWLTFDWDGDNDLSNNTVSSTFTVTYGASRGNDRVIYWREKN